MKQIYHVKIMVSDLENIFVRAENIEEAEKLALNKISSSDSLLSKDNINDYTESNHRIKIISTRKVEKYEIN